MGVLDSWNLFNETPVNDDTISDTVKFSGELSGPVARAFMLEASSRGISYNDFAKILIQQGLFFWAKQT